jgi:uncharacterized membrane protein YphA (DoxX/SURF4 family)
MDEFLQYSPEILLLLFLIITFLQSGLDKIFDWNGNLSWLRGHFENTPLKHMVSLLLGIIMITEMAAAILSSLGVVQLMLTGERIWAHYGAILCCVALLMLLFGQRMAKDYDGARTVAIYFIPAVFLVYLLQA